MTIFGREFESIWQKEQNTINGEGALDFALVLECLAQPMELRVQFSARRMILRLLRSCLVLIPVDAFIPGTKYIGQEDTITLAPKQKS